MAYKYSGRIARLLEDKIAEQESIIGVLRSQVRELQSKVETEPVEVLNIAVPESTVKLSKHYTERKDGILREMQELIEVCENPETNRYKKDKAKERLLYLSNIKVASKRL